MPDLFLDPIVRKKTKRARLCRRPDPAADIVAFLLTSKNDWKPASGTITKLSDASRKSLDKFVLENLRESFFEAAAERYAKSGIPASMAKELKGCKRN